MAIHNYHDAYTHLPAQAICDAEGKPLLSWRVALLPFFGEQNLYDKFQLDEPWDSGHNRPLLARMPAWLADPNADPATIRAGLTTIQVFTGPGTAYADPVVGPRVPRHHRRHEPDARSDRGEPRPGGALDQAGGSRVRSRRPARRPRPTAPRERSLLGRILRRQRAGFRRRHRRRGVPRVCHSGWGRDHQRPLTAAAERQPDGSRRRYLAEPSIYPLARVVYSHT